MDNIAYQKYLKDKDAENDSICKRCGVCCGANNDPCINLARNKDGSYRCLVYNDRLGLQKTVGGNIFICARIRDNIKKGFVYPGCAYLRG